MLSNEWDYTQEEDLYNLNTSLKLSTHELANWRKNMWLKWFSKSRHSTNQGYLVLIAHCTSNHSVRLWLQRAMIHCRLLFPRNLEGARGLSTYKALMALKFFNSSSQPLRITYDQLRTLQQVTITGCLQSDKFVSISSNLYVTCERSLDFQELNAFSKNHFSLT